MGQALLERSDLTEPGLLPGFDEAVTWSFLPKAQAELFGGGGGELELANPISTEGLTLDDETATRLLGEEAARVLQTAREAIEQSVLEANRNLREVIAGIAQDRGGALSSKRLGNWLRSRDGRIVGGKMFCRAGESRDHVTLWKVSHAG